MKGNLFKGKSARTKIFSVITVALLVVLLAANLALTYFGNRYTLFLDLTREGFYTVSDKMAKSCEAILEEKEADGSYRLKYPVKVIFCDDPDNLVSKIDTRMSYYMALDIQNEFDNFEVQTVNVRVNPAAVAMYKTTSRSEIKPTDVIISYGAKYRVLDANWWLGDYFSYNGEYRLVSVMASLTAVSQPAVYFTTDHGETYYNPDEPESQGSLALSALADLLLDCGFTIKNLKLSEVDKIPEDCTLLIINNPTRDFEADGDRLDEFSYVSDLEKIDRYLVGGSGAVIFNKDYRVDLPLIETLLSEWGIYFGDVQVRDTESTLDDYDVNFPELHGATIVGTYDTGEYSLGAAYYGDYALLPSAPKMIFTNAGYLHTMADGTVLREPGKANAQRTYASFIGTTSAAEGFDPDSPNKKLVGAGKKDLAAMSVREEVDEYTGDITYSYLFSTNTADFFSNELLENASYANRDILVSLVQNISRTERHASIELGGTSYNSTSFGGKQSISAALSETATKIYGGDGSYIGDNKAFTVTDRGVFTAVVFIAPALSLILGAAMFIRRKFL